MTAPAAGAERIRAAIGQVPLLFEANAGQTDERVQFLARGPGYALFLTADEAVLSLRPAAAKSQHRTTDSRYAADSTQDAERSTQHSVVRMQLVGADAAAAVAGKDQLPGKANYFIGDDPARWRTDVPTYARVQYREVYPGVDLVYYGNQGQLEYDFVVAPGADPSAIRLAFAGPDGVSVDAAGDLLLETGAGPLRQRKPVVYQDGVGGRQEVPGSYHLADDGEVRFALDAYDATRPLVIDPVLVYGTYLGGSFQDQALSIAVDSAGSAYVTGVTTSADFPTGGTSCATPPCVIGARHDQMNVFVTKFNPAGSNIVYSTYLGGNTRPGTTTIFQEGRGIAVDAQGQAYVAGYTEATNFPTTSNAFSNTCADQCATSDVFVSKLNATGSALLYSTFLGGTSADEAFGIAVDGNGNAYVTGTASVFFPTTPGAYSTGLFSNFGSFVSKINTTVAAGQGASSLVYSARLAANDTIDAYDIAVDGQGITYITGRTPATNFPTTPNAFQPTRPEGAVAAFVMKLIPDRTITPAINQIAYSTYLAGTNSSTVGQAIALDHGCSSNCSAYVTGYTFGDDFPTTPGAFDRTFSGVMEVIVTKLNPTGTGLVYSTFLGGSDPTFVEEGRSIAVDTAGQAHVTGNTRSDDFPSQNPLLGPFGGPALGGAFVTKLNAAGSALDYSTRFGADTGEDIALDIAGNAYIAGTTPGGLLTTVGAFDTTYNGGFDAFVVKLNPASGPTATPTTTPTPVPCQPRPPVTVAVTREGSRLRVVVSAGMSGNPSNRIQSIQFQATQGALLDMPNGPTVVTGSTGPITQTFSPGVTSYTFFIRQQTPSAAATSRFTVNDNCGAWPTFAGGGPSAFASGDEGLPAAPSATPVAAAVTPTPTATAGPAPAPAATPGTAARAATCAPRPPVAVTSASNGTGGLQVTVAANRAANAELLTLRFGAATNALVDVPGGPTGASGSFNVTLPPGTTQTTFVVRRATAGQGVSVPLTVVDSCGEWPTLVGGGASAF